MGTIVCAGISAPSKTIVPVKVPREIAATIESLPLAAAGPDESGCLGLPALGCVAFPPPHPKQTATTATKGNRQERIVEPNLMAITPVLGIEFEEDCGIGIIVHGFEPHKPMASQLLTVATSRPQFTTDTSCQLAEHRFLRVDLTASKPRVGPTHRGRSGRPEQHLSRKQKELCCSIPVVSAVIRSLMEDHEAVPTAS